MTERRRRRRAARPGSAFWTVVFRLSYRVLRLSSPALGRVVAMGLLPNVVRLTTVGRRSGRSRATLVTLLVGAGHWYVGHPNGRSGWTRNLAATGSARIQLGNGLPTTVRARALSTGPERDRAIAAAIAQQPWPANWLYRASERHVRAVGIYFRLDPEASIDAGAVL